MCTAIRLTTRDHYFGRNLDLEYSYQETVAITPRHYPFHFRHEGTNSDHFAMIGMAFVVGGMPLYYEATNEKGLSMAGLNFPASAVYHDVKPDCANIASFELIPYILGQCESVQEAKTLLQRLNITRDGFSEQLPPSPLHWMIDDREGCIVVESMADGLHVYDNWSNVMTNEPPLPLQLENLVIATPDVGGSKRASTFSKYLGVPLVLCNKSREKANEVASMQIIGDVEGKNVVLIDDIVDTAGTITKAANIMLDAGAKSVRAIASHCVMSDPASFRVQESALTEMVFTDSIPYAKKCPKVKQLSIADMFAETIKRVMNNESISSQYII